MCSNTACFCYYFHCRYDEYGYEMINITYVGDTLIATKVTGDEHVPQGEISFQCDLSPRLEFKSKSSFLEPIELNKKASRNWGKRYLSRFSGKGQVASLGFQNAQWVNGQLILVGKCFSFVWMDTGHKVFFKRPSDEVLLETFRNLQEEDPVGHMRRIAESMLDDTELYEQEIIDSYKYGCFE